MRVGRWCRRRSGTHSQCHLVLLDACRRSGDARAAHVQRVTRSRQTTGGRSCSPGAAGGACTIHVASDQLLKRINRPRRCASSGRDRGRSRHRWAWAGHGWAWAGGGRPAVVAAAGCGGLGFGLWRGGRRGGRYHHRPGGGPLRQLGRLVRAKERVDARADRAQASGTPRRYGVP